MRDKEEERKVYDKEERCVTRKRGADCVDDSK